MRAKRHFEEFGKTILAMLLIGMILLLDAMAACHELHELIHKDADEHSHDCAVTMFSHGKVESETVDVPIAAAVISMEATPQIKFFILSTTTENLLHGRAPPVLSAVS
jgi:hypothetical protein